MTTTPDYEGARQYALQRLAQELPPAKTYHCLRHTRDDVLAAATRLAELEGVSGEALLCLQTAACFHDLGHIYCSQGHEDLSARMAAEVLPRFGYSPEQIALIERLIRVTKVPQQPTTLLEYLIVDADMDSLGREDFLETSLALRAELAAAGTTFSDADWYRGQIAFLSAHRYFTRAAQALRDPGKQHNLARLHQLLEYCATPEAHCEDGQA